MKTEEEGEDEEAEYIANRRRANPLTRGRRCVMRRSDASVSWLHQLTSRIFNDGREMVIRTIIQEGENHIPVQGKAEQS